jgi:hypothetical protein
VSTSFHLPPSKELATATWQQRLNIFRRYFASSRYNRLLIQQTLVRSVADGSHASKVKDMEDAHNIEFSSTIERIKEAGYLDEFLVAAKEEDEALQKIIEAYNIRMNKS